MFEQHLVLAQELDAVLRVEHPRYDGPHRTTAHRQGDLLDRVTLAWNRQSQGKPPASNPLKHYASEDRALVAAWNEARPRPTSDEVPDLYTDRELLTRPGDVEHSVRQVAAVCRLEFDARRLEERADVEVADEARRLRAAATDRRRFAADIDRATTPVTEWAESVLSIRPADRAPAPTPALTSGGKW